MGFLKSKKGSIISDYFQCAEQYSWCDAEIMCDIALYDTHLEITPLTAKQPISLDYPQITDVFYGVETDIIQKEKSPIGRALLGGAMFGGVGAVVGAISGGKTKSKKVHRFVFAISYKSSQNEDCVITFIDTRMYKGAKVARKLKELTNISEKEAITHL